MFNSNTPKTMSIKKIIVCIILIMVWFAADRCSAEVVRDGNNFSISKSSGRCSKSIETQYSYTYNGTQYPIWLSKSGRAYIKVVSKSGNPYNKYLDPEVSKTICKELNIEYVEPKKK